MTRIKLQFFHVNRACSYCFIKRDFSSINDLMNHIGKLFHIKSFCLVLNSCVLPAVEDIQIVQNDDTILVMPNLLSELPLPREKNITEKQVGAETNDIQKSKKRRMSSCEFNDPVATSSAKKVANVETRVQYFNSLSNHSTEPTSDLNDSHKQNRSQECPEYEAMDTVKIETKHQKITKYQKHRSQSSSMKEASSESNEYNTPTTNSKSDNCLKQKLPQHITPVTNSLPNINLKKNINIVHDIVFYNGSVHNSNEKSVEICSGQQESQESSTPPDKVSTTTTSINKNKNVEVCNISKNTYNNKRKASSEEVTMSFKEDCNISKNVKVNCTLKKKSKHAEKQLQNSVGNLLNNLRSNSHEGTPLASCSNSFGDQTENIAICETNCLTSKIRHRSKRKTHFDTPMPTHKVVYHKENVETKPLIHRFHEDDEEVIEEVNINKHKKNIETIFLNDHENCENSSIIGVNDTLTESNEHRQCVADTEQSLTKEKKNLSIMNKLFPRSGDVIVFQILKLQLNCTPCVSKYIVARVLSFDVTTQQTELLILDGFSEFKNLQDIKSEEGEQVPNKKLIMDWKLLINPRLLSATV